MLFSFSLLGKRTNCNWSDSLVQDQLGGCWSDQGGGYHMRAHLPCEHLFCPDFTKNQCDFSVLLLRQSVPHILHVNFPYSLPIHISIYSISISLMPMEICIIRETLWEVNMEYMPWAGSRWSTSARGEREIETRKWHFLSASSPDSFPPVGFALRRSRARLKRWVCSQAIARSAVSLAPYASLARL